MDGGFSGTSRASVCKSSSTLRRSSTASFWPAFFALSATCPGAYEPFETRVRIEFHDESDGRTRLEVRQWLSEHLIAPSENGWAEGFSKLDATLAARMVAADNV